MYFVFIQKGFRVASYIAGYKIGTWLLLLDSQLMNEAEYQIIAC